MKNCIVAMFAALFLFCIPFQLQAEFVPKTITYSPKKPVVGDRINFRNTSSPSSCIGWDFGDGTRRDINNSSKATPTHSYKRAGTFTVKAWNVDCDYIPSDPPTQHVRITVGDKEIEKKGTISIKPSNPREGEEVAFSFKGFKSSCITWHFGDGKREKGKSTSSHTYMKPGSYTVKIYADCGKKLSASKSIKINKVNRSLTASKKKVAVGEPVTFKTRDFTDCIKWDFGDRQTINKGKKQEKHTFKKAGKFTVKAFDQCGASGIKAESVHVKVEDPSLQITDVKLTLNGGEETVKVVLKKLGSGHVNI